MPSYTHRFRCVQCSQPVEFRNQSSDADNPRLPSLLHVELATHVEEQKPRARQRPVTTVCEGRMLWCATEQIALPVHAPPPVFTALQRSNEFAASTAAGGTTNTVCAAVDVATQAYKKGVNAHGLRRDQLHATLQGLLDRVEAMEAWSIDNCAEIQAVDKLLRDGSNARDIRVHSRYLDLQSKPPCDNCQGWLTAVGDHTFRLRV